VNRKYLVVARRAQHRCEYCRAPEAAFNFQFEIEHIQPSSDGGSSEDSNLALGCRSCNQFKSDSTTGDDPVTGEIARLFHPRTDRWEEHFSIDSEHRIVGLMVWVFYPKLRFMRVHRLDRPPERLEEIDTLTGTPVLPEFSVLVGELFPAPDVIQ
jgi:hypothetical protein